MTFINVDYNALIMAHISKNWLAAPGATVVLSDLSTKFPTEVDKTFDLPWDVNAWLDRAGLALREEQYRLAECLHTGAGEIERLDALIPSTAS